MAEMQYTAKDSVFSFIFRQPENTRRLYQALHPEDTDVSEADCKLVTLEHVLTNGITNDLGFQVRDKLILLVEAQSKFSVNIALRGCAEIEIKVLRETGTGSIVDQYIQFCEISDEQRRQHGYTMKAVEETLRICVEKNILMPFLASRQKEVQDIMVTLFNQERVTEIHEYNLAKEARQEGREEGICAMVLTLKELAVDKAAIVQKLIKQFELLPQTAEEKVAQYWSS